MNSVFGNLRKAVSILFSDKFLMFLSMFPIVIGTILYIYLGSWFYDLVMVKGQTFIQARIGSDTGASIAYWVLLIIFSVLLFFVVNWTFIMIVSILSSPFNDLISSRVERKHLGIELLETNKAFSQMIRNVFKTIWNEVKKVTLIMLLTAISLVLSFIPFLAPVTVIISALLLTIQFVDYSWARHRWKTATCVRDIIGNIFPYGIAGFIFMMFMSIPGVNLLALPVAVIYFTLLFVDKNKKKLVRGSN